MVKLEYAGHGKRHKEAFYTDFEELADDLYDEIKRTVKPSEKYALMGYSMGSISLVEILKKILGLKEIMPPKHVFLAAHEPLNRKELKDIPENKRDEFIKARTIRFGGIPEKLLNNQSFWRMYLPIYRNDYMMIGKYDFDKLDLKTQIAATVFYSQSDTPVENMKLWKKYFIGKSEFIEFNGSHFFIQEHCQEIGSMINDRLQMEEKNHDI